MADPVNPSSAPPSQEIQSATVDLTKLSETQALLARQTATLTDYYKSLGESIKSVGFTKALEEARQQIDATRDLQKSVGDLTAEYSATERKIKDLSSAANEAESILINHAKELQKLQEDYQKKLEEHAATQKDIDTKRAIANKEYADNLAKQQKLQAEFDTQKNKNLTDLGLLEEKIKNAKMASDKYQFIEQLKDLKQRRLKEEAILQQQLQAQTILVKINAEELANLNTKQTEINLMVEQARLAVEHEKHLEKEAAAMLPLLRYEKLREESLNKINDSMDSLLSKLTSGAERSNIFGTAFLAIQKSVIGAGGGIQSFFTNISDGLMKSLLDPEKAVNRVFNLINDKLIKSTLEFDKTLAEVGKNTGGFRKEFEDVAIKMGGMNFMPLTEFGVTLEKYSQTYASLSKSIGNFNNLLISQRKLLTDNAASLETLGVTADMYGKLVSVFMASLNKSLEGSRQMMEQLARDAVGLGKSVAQYTEGFQNALSRISGYGREAITIFKELNALAMSTNEVITSQDLLNISDKFKDFDSAAEAVSKLNAVMGGVSVSILDMMKADPAEQIMMIKRAASESGLEFDKLNIGYKRLLAEYFGGDINKAAAFFKADIAEANNLLNKAAATEEEITKRKEQNVAFQNKLNALTDNMRVMLTPILDIANKIVSGLAKVFNFPGGPMIAAIGMITTAFIAMQIAIGRVTTVVMEKVAAINAARAAAQNETAAVVEGSAAEVAARREVLATERALAAARRESASAGGGTPTTGKAPFLSSGAKTGLIGAAALGGIMLTSFGLKQYSEKLENERVMEREQFISKLKINEKSQETELLRQLQISPPPTPSSTSVEDVLFITGDDGKTVKESYKLSAGDKMLPVGKQGGPLETVFNPTTNQSLNNFNETKSELTSTNNTGGSIRQGDKSNVLNTTNNIQQAGEMAVPQKPSSLTEAQRTGNTINLTAYLTLDGRKMQLITEKISENLNSTVPV